MMYCDASSIAVVGSELVPAAPPARSSKERSNVEVLMEHGEEGRFLATLLVIIAAAQRIYQNLES
jgi:hypothetical protein